MFYYRDPKEWPPFFQPAFFVPKDVVDAVGLRIEIARKSGKKARRPPKVPDEAVDACENSFEAADEKQAKAHGKRFDDTGLMALVCRHDIPLFLRI